MIQIKVDQSISGWGPLWQAYDENQGLDYDWTGDGWESCGSKLGTGNTIPEAIEDFLEQVEETEYKWS